ncbi:MAG: diguanylate cyclase [Thermoanaerobaculia bacterium]|nr:diguanylate cyclase [Thermoanaerobaculia bacterium]
MRHGARGGARAGRGGALGGEELILLLPETTAEGAFAAAEAVRRAVAGSPVEVDGESVELRISLGVAEHRPDRTLDATIAAADHALYRAKETGRDRVVAG